MECWTIWRYGVYAKGRRAGSLNEQEARGVCVEGAGIAVFDQVEA